MLGFPHSLFSDAPIARGTPHKPFLGFLFYSMVRTGICRAVQRQIVDSIIADLIDVINVTRERDQSWNRRRTLLTLFIL